MAAEWGQNFALAEEWYRKAIDAGNVEAMVNLAYCYEYGLGVERDEAQAEEWYQRAADAGNADAVNYYHNGNAEMRNYRQVPYTQADW